jgi:hypothetical protein
MKKCMSGCGGKMSKGGKVTPKKMANGGALKPLGAKIGVGVNLAGMLGTGVKMIVDKIKEKNAKKKALTEKNTPVQEPKKNGGAKYKTGGIAKQKIVAFPGYNARTDTMKMGGFKDLSGDGKITKKDVLIGRGVIKKPIKKK